MARHALPVATLARSDIGLAEWRARVDNDGVGCIDHRRLVRGCFLAIVAHRRCYRTGDVVIAGLDRELCPGGHDLRRAVLGAAMDSRRRYGLERERTGLHIDERNHRRAICPIVALTAGPRRELHEDRRWPLHELADFP